MPSISSNGSHSQHSETATTSAPAAAANKGVGISVSVRGIHKRYQTKRGEFHAVRGVDLDIEPGTFVALLGKTLEGGGREGRT